MRSGIVERRKSLLTSKVNELFSVKGILTLRSLGVNCVKI